MKAGSLRTQLYTPTINGNADDPAPMRVRLRSLSRGQLRRLRDVGLEIEDARIAMLTTQQEANVHQAKILRTADVGDEAAVAGVDLDRGLELQQQLRGYRDLLQDARQRRREIEVEILSQSILAVQNLELGDDEVERIGMADEPDPQTVRRAWVLDWPALCDELLLAARGRATLDADAGNDSA